MMIWEAELTPARGAVGPGILVVTSTTAGGMVEEGGSGGFDEVMEFVTVVVGIEVEEKGGSIPTALGKSEMFGAASSVVGRELLSGIDDVVDEPKTPAPPVDWRRGFLGTNFARKDDIMNFLVKEKSEKIEKTENETVSMVKKMLVLRN